jgi:hypothetical protein
VERSAVCPVPEILQIKKEVRTCELINNKISREVKHGATLKAKELSLYTRD